MALPKPLENLIGELSRFPGVGRRSAERMAFDLVSAPSARPDALVAALTALQTEMGICEDCGYFTEDGKCLICSGDRQRHTLLVVEKPMDIIALEKAGGYRGLYHILGGHLSPLKGIGPDDLRLDGLFRRIEREPVVEIILATSSTVEGDATALYIARHIVRGEISVTRLGRGVPMGGALEFADAGTLRMAIEGRRAMDA